MKILRFLFFLLLVFLICFALSGGYTVSLFDALGPSAASRTAAQSAPGLAEKNAAGPPTAVSGFDRIKRLIFLKQSVAKSLPAKNYVILEDISLPMQQAIIAIEDNRFYSHWGFDLAGIMRASLVNLQYGRIEEGASTITQQLVKNLFLSHEQTVGRKADELLLALDMEWRYPKEQILELYLNTIYFGSDFYGIAEASRGYFGKKPADLSLAEAAMLAGLPNAPSLYSPYVDYSLAKKRQAVVLDALTRNGLISPALADKAKAERLAFVRDIK